MAAQQDEQKASFERALRKKAMGYRVVESKETIEEDEAGKRKTKRERTRKHIQPDLEALRLWMSHKEGGGQEGIRVVCQVPRPEAQPGLGEAGDEGGMEAGEE